MNPVAIERHLVLVLIQWIIIIVAAHFFGRLGKRFGQPLAVGRGDAGRRLDAMLQGGKGEISLTRGVGMAVNGDHATLFVELF